MAVSRVLADVAALVAAHSLSLLIIAGTLYFLRNYFYKGLNKHPGPILASLTDWWRFHLASKRRPEREYRRLHDLHGDIIRIGPNQLSFSSPEAVKTIYALNNGFIKVRNLHCFAQLLMVTVSDAFNRVISIPCMCLCRKANVLSLCLRQTTRSITRSLDEMSPTPSR